MGSIRPPTRSRATSPERKPPVRNLKEVSLKPVDGGRGLATKGLEVGGFAARHISLPQDTFDYAWKGSSHYLALHDIQLRDGEIRGDDHAPVRSRDLRGRLTFVPAGCRIWGWSAPAVAGTSFTAIYFDPREIESSLETRFRNAAKDTQIYFSNAALNSTVSKIRDALRTESADALYVETLCVLSALEICNLQPQRAAPEADGGGRLTRLQRQRLDEYIASHLGSDIGLGDLAQVAGLSRFHFIRIFKNTTGKTPYQHVIERRLERAAGLLERGQATVEQAARDSGFKNTSRFIRAFRGSRGVTPGELRLRTAKE